MATCKDCFHFEVCNSGRHIGEYEIDDGVYTEGVENECLTFKNKADVVEVKHGHFVRNERNIPKMKEFHERGYALSMNEKSVFYTCSECGEWISLSQKFCGECGAIMDGE